MIILMSKKNMATICALIMAIVVLWFGYHYLSGQKTLSYDDQGVLPTTAKATALKIVPENPIDSEPPEIPAAGEFEENGEEVVLQAETILPSEMNLLTSGQEEIIQMRLERNRNRDMQVESLEKLLSSENISPETKTEAEQKLLQNTQERFLEAQTETLLKTKGYQNILVLIDFNNAKVFAGSELTEGDYLKIGDLVHKGTNFKLEEIIIIPK